MGWWYRAQSHTVSFNKVLACLSVKLLVAKYDWNVLFMLTGLRRCCNTAQKPGRCKQGITAKAVKIWRQESIHTFVVFLLTKKKSCGVCLKKEKKRKRKWEKRKIVKSFKIYSMPGLPPNPKQGTVVHTRRCQPRGNENKSKAVSPVPQGPIRESGYGYGWAGLDFFLNLSLCLPYKVFLQDK